MKNKYCGVRFWHVMTFAKPNYMIWFWFNHENCGMIFYTMTNTEYAMFSMKVLCVWLLYLVLIPWWYVTRFGFDFTVLDRVIKVDLSEGIYSAAAGGLTMGRLSRGMVNQARPLVVDAAGRPQGPYESAHGLSTPWVRARSAPRVRLCHGHVHGLLTHGGLGHVSRQDGDPVTSDIGSRNWMYMFYWHSVPMYIYICYCCKWVCKAGFRFVYEPKIWFGIMPWLHCF